MCSSRRSRTGSRRSPRPRATEVRCGRQVRRPEGRFYQTGPGSRRVSPGSSPPAHSANREDSERVVSYFTSHSYAEPDGILGLGASPQRSSTCRGPPRRHRPGQLPCRSVVFCTRRRRADGRRSSGRRRLPGDEGPGRLRRRPPPRARAGGTARAVARQRRRSKRRVLSRTPPSAAPVPPGHPGRTADHEKERP